MGERADEPDKIEKPEASNSSTGEPSAHAGGASEHNNLPVVWSPKLDAGAEIEEDVLVAHLLAP